MKWTVSVESLMIQSFERALSDRTISDRLAKRRPCPTKLTMQQADIGYDCPESHFRADPSLGTFVLPIRKRRCILKGSTIGRRAGL